VPEQRHLWRIILEEAYIEQCGPNWFLPVLRFSTCEASAIEKWLKADAATLDPSKLKPGNAVRILMLFGLGQREIWVPLVRPCGTVKDLDGSERLNRADF
jgi:hypothetical protein